MIFIIKDNIPAGGYGYRIHISRTGYLIKDGSISLSYQENVCGYNSIREAIQAIKKYYPKVRKVKRTKDNDYIRFEQN